LGILGPDDVPGLSKYRYKIEIPEGKTATDIVWTVDKTTATFEGPTNQVESTVKYANTKADWIKLQATFKIDGDPKSAEKQIALVKVDVGPATFLRLGKPKGQDSGPQPFLIRPSTWVTRHDPGSDCAAFTYNGNQAPEPSKVVLSVGGGINAAYDAITDVTLTSPTEKPAALQQIQVGYIQHASASGSAAYDTTPPGKKRTITTPANNALDWLSSPCSPGGLDDWPWFHKHDRETGSGTGSWTKTFHLDDDPAVAIPAQYNPNCASEPNRTKPLTSATITYAFVIRIGARTLDTDLGADRHYFDEANSTWSIDFAWPVVPGITIVTIGPAWTKPAEASEIDVNVVPANTNVQAPFLRWIPDNECPQSSSSSSS